jgi:putative tryptophan/tyrosine transport system substrate-binding protein
MAAKVVLFVWVDYRLAGIDADNLRKYAAELVALAPDVILAQSSPAIAPLLQATRTVPIGGWLRR